MDVEDVDDDGDGDKNDDNVGVTECDTMIWGWCGIGVVGELKAEGGGGCVVKYVEGGSGQEYAKIAESERRAGFALWKRCWYPIVIFILVKILRTIGRWNVIPLERPHQWANLNKYNGQISATVWSKEFLDYKFYIRKNLKT